MQEEAKAEEESERQPKRLRVGKGVVVDEGNSGVSATASVDIGFFSKIPPELSHRILKFLSSEVLSLSTIYFLSFFTTLVIY